MDYKRREVAPRIRVIHDAELQRFYDMAKHQPSFLEAISKPDELCVIAEVKRRSPSAGMISDESLNAVDQARQYYNAGADALSILTDGPSFGGSIKDLWEVVDFLNDHRRPIPCLRKDFMVHPIQVVEAAEAGARAILIIVRALTDDEISMLYNTANAAGLDSIFEIHEEAELEKALRHNPRIIGVNNRDLKRFITDIGISEYIIPQIPDDIVRISESGFWNGEDAARAKAIGTDCLLVGESLMKSDDPESLINEFKHA